jgi:collagenase-like PrtC family protease
VETPQGRESRLNGVLIDRYAPGENAGYPTLCKGRFDVEDDKNYYAIEEPTSLNTLSLLPELMKMGVRAIKIEGRQRSPAYVAQVTKVWRQAIDSCRDNPHRYTPSRPGSATWTRWPRASSTRWAPTTGPWK